MEAHDHDIKTIDRLEEENGKLQRDKAALLAALEGLVKGIGVIDADVKLSLATIQAYEAARAAIKAAS